MKKRLPEHNLFIWMIELCKPTGRQITPAITCQMSETDNVTYWSSQATTLQCIGHQLEIPLVSRQSILHLKTRSSKDECSTGDQTIILGLQIFLDHRSLSSIDQNILMTLPLPPFSILGGHWRWSGCLLSPIHHLSELLSFCLSVFLSFCPCLTLIVHLSS